MNGIVLTHGAGSNADAPLLVALAGAFEAAGWRAVRYNLPYRQLRPSGLPFPAQAAADRAGLAQEVAKMRASVDGVVVAGGHSYGGRQASMRCRRAARRSSMRCCCCLIRCTLP